MQIKIRKGYIAVLGESWPLKLARFLSGHKNATISTTPPFIFFLNTSLERPDTVNHEKIHLRQMYELLYIFAIILQQIEFWYARLILKKSSYDAYKFTSLEQEAYLNHNNPNYLKERKMFAVFKYVFNKKDFTYNKDTGEVIIEN